MPITTIEIAASGIISSAEDIISAISGDGRVRTYIPQSPVAWTASVEDASERFGLPPLSVASIEAGEPWENLSFFADLTPAQEHVSIDTEGSCYGPPDVHPISAFLQPSEEVVPPTWQDVREAQAREFAARHGYDMTPGANTPVVREIPPISARICDFPISDEQRDRLIGRCSPYGAPISDETYVSYSDVALAIGDVTALRLLCAAHPMVVLRHLAGETAHFLPSYRRAIARALSAAETGAPYRWREPDGKGDHGFHWLQLDAVRAFARLAKGVRRGEIGERDLHDFTRNAGPNLGVIERRLLDLSPPSNIVRVTTEDTRLIWPDIPADMDPVFRALNLHARAGGCTGETCILLGTEYLLPGAKKESWRETGPAPRFAAYLNQNTEYPWAGMAYRYHDGLYTRYPQY